MDRGRGWRRGPLVALAALVLGVLIAQIAVAGEGSSGESDDIASLQRQVTQLKSQFATATAAKKKRKRGPRGLQGPPGQQGAQGPPGPPGSDATIGPQEDWHLVGGPGEPPFQNNWVNGDTTNFFPAGFYKDAFGEVHLRGLVSGGTTPTIFQLPVGYRPGKSMYFAASQANGTYAELTISFSGLVGRNNFVAPSGSFFLDGTTFRAGG